MVGPIEGHRQSGCGQRGVDGRPDATPPGARVERDTRDEELASASASWRDAVTASAIDVNTHDALTGQDLAHQSGLDVPRPDLDEDAYRQRPCAQSSKRRHRAGDLLREHVPHAVGVSG